MTSFCDRSHDRPQPLGTVLPCGCIVRAILVTCPNCTDAWLATPTDVEVGGYLRIKGTCSGCGIAVDQQARVYERLIPPALRARG